MPRTIARYQRLAQLQCAVCKRCYSKKEHLQRHERSHTGDKPFACDTCGKCFARQDALHRHERLHQGLSSPGAATPERPEAAMYTQPLPDIVQFEASLEGVIPSPLDSSSTFARSDFTGAPLFWPDSEGLLQNIMSIDPAVWEQPMPLMQPILAHSASPDLVYGLDTTDTAGDEGHKAIETLSAQLSRTLTGVASPASLTQLTPRFLDSCLHMFFSSFIPILPVLHRPTFVFRECSAPLLLNAIAIGSLFLGTKEATIKGDALWRLAHTAVATSWHSMISRDSLHNGVSGLQLVQTSLLSQVYASLSKSRTLRMTSQVFHSLGFYWARYCGLFDLPDDDRFPSPDDPIDIIEQAWRTWLSRESQLRCLLGLYILDGLISQYSGNPTVAQHMSNQLPMPSEEGIFTATHASEWMQRLVSSSTAQSLRFCDVFRILFYPEDSIGEALPTNLTFFALKVVLEGLKSLVAESKRIEPRPVGVPSLARVNLVLDRIREYIIRHPTLTSLERLSVMLRWHAICLDTWKVAARGARRLCFGHGIKQNIFGGRERIETDINPDRYLDRDDARRTLLHAREIQNICSQLPLGLAHDPHVPGAIFAAATTYAAFALAGRTRIVFPDIVDWHVAVTTPSMDATTMQTAANEAQDSHISNTTESFLRGTLEVFSAATNIVILDLSYEMNRIRLLLRGLSLQWGVCIEMEEVVDAWIAKCL